MTAVGRCASVSVTLTPDDIMTFGFQTLRPNGSTMLDGLSKGGVLVDIITIPKKVSGSRSYPQASSSQALRWVVVSGFGTLLSTSTVNNAATLSWTYSTSVNQSDSTVVYVFATALLDYDPFGIQLVNDAGETLADQGFPSPQYVTTLTLNPTPDFKILGNEGYDLYYHSTPVTDPRPGSNKLVVVSLPDPAGADLWYCVKKEYILASEGAVAIQAIIFSYIFGTDAPTSYMLPTIHIFALDNLAPSSDTFGIRLDDRVGNLTFDSGAECLVAKASLLVDYGDPGYGVSNTYNMTAGTVGVTMPYWCKSQLAPGSDTQIARYVSVVQRRYTQITTRTYHEWDTDLQNFPDDKAADYYEIGVQKSHYCAVVDTSQYPQPSVVVQTSAASSRVYSPPAGSVDIHAFTGPVDQPYTANLTLEFSSTPTPTLQWYEDGVAMSGSTDPSITVSPVAGQNGTKFWCVMTNPVASTRTGYIVFTDSATSAPSISNITVSPGTTVPPGTVVTVSFRASGTPTPTCYIANSSTNVASGTGSVSYSFTASSSVTSYGFTLTADANDGSAGHVTTSNVTVYVQGGGSATYTPIAVSSQPTPQTATEATTATFTAGFSGTAPFRFQWYRDAAAIAGANSNSYSLTTSLNDNGATFYCIGSNGPGVGDNGASGTVYTAQTSTVSLTVTAASGGGGGGTPSTPAPNISQQPAPTTSVIQGNSASLSIVASPATGYQWYLGGSPISGATNSTLAVDTSTVGTFTYYCIVSNSTVTTQSSNATVTVSAPAAATFQSYSTISGSASEYNASAQFNIFGDGHYDFGLDNDSGLWGNPQGGGDGSLYEVRADASGYTIPAYGSFAFGTWYSFNSGVGWAVAPNGNTGHVSNTILNITVRLKGGSTVTTGTVTLTTRNGGVQA